MRRKNAYVVDIDSEFQVLIFKTYDLESKDETWDFYLSDGFYLVYQFGLPCKSTHYFELEEIARNNFANGNMSMMYELLDIL